MSKNKNSKPNLTVLPGKTKEQEKEEVKRVLTGPDDSYIYSFIRGYAEELLEKSSAEDMVTLEDVENELTPMFIGFLHGLSANDIDVDIDRAINDVWGDVLDEFFTKNRDSAKKEFEKGIKETEEEPIYKKLRSCVEKAINTLAPDAKRAARMAIRQYIDDAESDNPEIVLEVNQVAKPKDGIRTLGDINDLGFKLLKQCVYVNHPESGTIAMGHLFEEFQLAKDAETGKLLIILEMSDMLMDVYSIDAQKKLLEDLKEVDADVPVAENIRRLD